VFRPGTAPADLSTWADEIRPSRPNPGPWHFVNIPGGATGYEASRDYPRRWIVSALNHFLAVLGDAHQDRSTRQEALQWVVHFVADLHQPLHAIAEDRGGNAVLVQFNGR